MADVITRPLEFGTATRSLHFRRQTSDESAIQQVLVQAQYDLRRLRREPELSGYLDRQRSKGRRPLVVDAGANIGAASLYFAHRWPDALIVSVEPDASNYELLCKNIEGLNIEPIRVNPLRSTGNLKGGNLVSCRHHHLKRRVLSVASSIEVANLRPAFRIAGADRTYGKLRTFRAGLLCKGTS